MALIQIDSIKRDTTSQDITYLINTERIIGYYSGGDNTILYYREEEGYKNKARRYEITNALSHFNELSAYNRGYKFVTLNIIGVGLSEEAANYSLTVSINHIVKAWDGSDGYGRVEVENGLFEHKMYKTQETISTIQSNGNLSFADALFEIAVGFQVHNSAAFTASLTDADTYYTLDNANLFMDIKHKFSFSDGIMQYEGDKKARINFDGAADIQALDRRSRVTFAMFRNESIDSNEITPTDFTNLDRLKNISITAIMDLDPGDQMSVRAKSSEASNGVNVASFHFSGKGHYIE